MDYNQEQMIAFLHHAEIYRKVGPVDQIDTNLALVFCIGHHANKLKGPGKLRFPRYTLARTRLVLSARMR